MQRKLQCTNTVSVGAQSAAGSRASSASYAFDTSIYAVCFSNEALKRTAGLTRGSLDSDLDLWSGQFSSHLGLKSSDCNCEKMTEEIKPKGTPYGLAMGLLHEFADCLPAAVVLLPDHVLWPSDR
jgi:hypothetical protein